MEGGVVFGMVFFGMMLIGLIINIIRDFNDPPTEEETEWEARKLETQIAENEAIISRLHLDIFYDIPENDKDLTDLIMAKYYARKKKGYCEWQIPEVAWSRLQKIREPNGAYLFGFRETEVLTPPEYKSQYQLIGIPVEVSPDFKKFDLKCL